MAEEQEELDGSAEGAREAGVESRIELGQRLCSPQTLG
jgi:hypothetical protein